MVSIAARDFRTPYDYRLRTRLTHLAEKAGIPHVVEVFPRYASDATQIVIQGGDIIFACVGPGVEATHHYERTHRDGIIATAQLLVEYLADEEGDLSFA
jgi:aminopeptidase